MAAGTDADDAPEKIPFKVQVPRTDDADALSGDLIIFQWLGSSITLPVQTGCIPSIMAFIVLFKVELFSSTFGMFSGPCARHLTAAPPPLRFRQSLERQRLVFHPPTLVYPVDHGLCQGSAPGVSPRGLRQEVSLGVR